jgi:uncharacterized membrane protein YdbT with pleckstrin-like domain
MEEKRIIISSGGGLSHLLGVSFIVLKLCNVINWSWLWVLSPFWITYGLIILISIIFYIILIIMYFIENRY